MSDEKWVWCYGLLLLYSFQSLYYRSIGCPWCVYGCNGHTVMCQSVSRAMSTMAPAGKHTFKLTLGGEGGGHGTDQFFNQCLYLFCKA